MIVGVGVYAASGYSGTSLRGALHSGFGRRGLGVVVMTRTVDACGPVWFACVV